MLHIERRSFLRMAVIAGLGSAAGLIADANPVSADKTPVQKQTPTPSVGSAIPGLIVTLFGMGLGAVVLGRRRNRIEEKNKERKAEEEIRTEWNKRLAGIPQLDSFRASKSQVAKGE